MSDHKIGPKQSDPREQWARSAFGLPIEAALKFACGWNFNVGLNARLITAANTGSASAPAWSSTTRLVTASTSAAASSSASLSTRKALRYINGIGARFVGTCKVIGAAGVTGGGFEFGIGDASDGLFFGTNPSTGEVGILLRSSIQGAPNTWTRQADWNLEKFDGTKTLLNPTGYTLDVTKINVYGHSFQYLGGGGLWSFIESPGLGRLVPVNVIQRAGLYTDMSMANPQLPIRAWVGNTSNTAAIALSTGSSAAFWEGDPSDALEISWRFSASKASISTTETAIFTIQNPSTIATVASRMRMQTRSLRVFADGTGNNPITVRIRRNATISGASYLPNITGDSTYSLADVAGAFTGAADGTVVFDETFPRLAALPPIDVSRIVDELLPGETLTVSMVTSATNFTGYASMGGAELI